MPDVSLPAPFEAYSGENPYIFASYAHADGAVVFPELTYLHDQGYRIWFDEGIDPGNEWPDEVAKALAGASHFLVFMSPNAVASKNVRDEINYAINHQKPFLAVHIAEAELAPGLELRMGNTQAIMKYRMGNDSYERKIEKTLPRELITDQAIGERELISQKTAQVADALFRVLQHEETWRMGLALFWKHENRLVLSRWEAYWDQIPPVCKRQAQEEMPPPVIRWQGESDLLQPVESWRGIDGEGTGGSYRKPVFPSMPPVSTTDAIPDYAARVLKCNRLLRPGAPVSQLRITISETPDISPWWTCDMPGPEPNYYCKICGSLSFMLSKYDKDRTVPAHCAHCGF